MIVTRAPLRIPLGGGGTDTPSYYNKYGGYVLGFAVQKYVYVTVHPTIDGKIRLKYSKNETVDCTDQLVNRVAAEALNFYGITGGLEIATFSDVPESSGLGGSSSFCVALIAAIRSLKDLALDRHQIFLDAYNIERIKAGQSGGIQDQFFASLGGCWGLTLGEAEPQMEMVQLNGLLSKLKLVHAGERKLTYNLQIADKQDADIKSDTVSTVESLHKTKELGKHIYGLVRSGKQDELGVIFNEHWENKKKRNPNITNPDLDAIYKRALESGATGGKLVGLGGGGYFLFYVPRELKGMEAIDLKVDWEGVKRLL